MMTLSAFVECMGWVSCCPWTNSSYVRIAVWVLEFEGVIGWRSMQYPCGRNATLIIYTHYNGNDGSALIFVCSMYGTTGVVLTLNQQLVRLYCCVCLNLKVLVIGV